MSPLHNIYCTPHKVFMVAIVTLQNTEFHNNDKQPNWGPVQRRAVIGWDLSTVLEWSLMHRRSRRHITMLIHNSKTDILCSWRRTMNACSLRQARRQEQTATRWAVLSTTAWILVFTAGSNGTPENLHKVWFHNVMNTAAWWKPFTQCLHIALQIRSSLYLPQWGQHAVDHYYLANSWYISWVMHKKKLLSRIGSALVKRFTYTICCGEVGCGVKRV